LRARERELERARERERESYRERARKKYFKAAGYLTNAEREIDRQLQLLRSPLRAYRYNNSTT
jgi:hypothetical protein